MKFGTKLFNALMILAALVLLIPSTVALALVSAAPPEPAYLEAGDLMSVDGDVADWNMDVTDFFADMHRAGDPGKKVEAKAYLRYDCGGILYVLVYTAGDWPVLAERDNSWVAIDSVGNKVVGESSPSFAWVDLGYDGDPTHAKGWEASFSIPQGTSKIFVHTNVYDDGQSQTSRTVPKQTGTDLTLDCYHPTAVTLASFEAAVQGRTVQLTWETASEFDTWGFNIYRAESEDGVRIKLNGSLLPVQSPGSPVGASYQFVDEAIVPGVTYYYWLEGLDLNGSSTFYGPVTGVVRLMHRLLPVRPRPVLATDPPIVRRP